MDVRNEISDVSINSGLKIGDSEGNIYDFDEALDGLVEAREYRQEKGIVPGEKLGFPLHVQMDVTNHCNLNCMFCFNSSSPGKDDELSADLLSRLFSEMGKHKVFEITLSGGEPLMDESRLTFLLEQAAHYRIAVRIVTNGWHLTDNVAEKLASYPVSYIQVSIDGGIPEVHDKLRGREGSWERAVNGLKSLCDHGIFTCVASIVHKENLEAIDEFIFFCSLLGVTRFILSDLMLFGRAQGSMEDLRLSDDEYEDLFLRISEIRKMYAGQMDVRLGIDPGFALRSAFKKIKTACLIRADGSVTPGCLVPVSVGNVYDDSLGSIWRNNFDELDTNREIIDFVNSKRIRSTPRLNLIRTE